MIWFILRVSFRDSLRVWVKIKFRFRVLVKVLYRFTVRV